jgi:single stranded DNA-binding protein
MYSKHVLLGRIGHDPELRYVSEGKANLVLRVATNESFKDSATGDWKEKTTWHRCVFFNQQAERAAQRAGKGKTIMIEGTPFDRGWVDDKTKQKVSVRELKVVKYRILDSAANSINPPVHQADDDGMDGYSVLD